MRPNETTSLTLEERPVRCPICGGEVWEIVYGEPTAEAYESRIEDKIIYGGCCVTGHDPAWECIKCHTQIYQAE